MAKVDGLRPGMLFDVDGTLVDTNYLHTLAWSRALRDAGEWAPMNAIHRLVGMGGDQLVPRLLGHDSAAAREARGPRYRELLSEARAFPGAAGLLHAVHERGLVVVLATSSPRDELETLIRLLGADDSIDTTTSADDVVASKPAPDVFRGALAAGGIDPRRALAVGDSVWDVQAASAAGIGCLAVETGGFSRDELDDAGAIAVFRDVGELLEYVESESLGWLSDASGHPPRMDQSRGPDGTRKPSDFGPPRHARNNREGS
jgi:HAD superfamily hydrolase (TIGR01509 family)